MPIRFTDEHRFSDELCPAPPVEDGGAPTEEHLRTVADDPASPDERRLAARFALGNMLLRRGDAAGAIDAFKRAIALDGNSGPLRLDYGVALLHSGAIEEGMLELRRSLLLDSQLKLAHFYLGRTLADRDAPSALEQLRRFLDSRPADAAARLLSARPLSAQGDEIGARAAYEQLIAAAPDNFAAQCELAHLDYRAGEALAREGNESEAFEIWGKSYRRFSRPFIADQRIAQGMRSLVAEYEARTQFQKELLRFQEQFRGNPEDRSIFHALVAHYLFSIGLLPEGYESAGELTAEEQRWERSLETRGEHPYPHFRLALIRFYRGELAGALLELSICRDRFPPKKLQALRIKELLMFHDHLREIERKKGEFLNLNLSDTEWERAGFDDQFIRRAWRETGLAPAEAARWLGCGFSAAKAAQWSKWQIDPLEASRWSLKGFENPQEVKLWIRGGFIPDEARRWTASCPLTLESIIQFRKAGFTDPELAFRWSEVLRLPLEANRWHELGFSPEETQEWRDLGFFEAQQAHDWRTRGFTPTSALRDFNSE